MQIFRTGTWLISPVDLSFYLMDLCLISLFPPYHRAKPAFILVHLTLRKQRDIVHRRELRSIRPADNLEHGTLLDLDTREGNPRRRVAVQKLGEVVSQLVLQIRDPGAD